MKPYRKGSGKGGWIPPSTRCAGGTKGRYRTRPGSTLCTLRLVGNSDNHKGHISKNNPLGIDFKLFSLPLGLSLHYHHPLFPPALDHSSSCPDFLQFFVVFCYFSSSNLHPPLTLLKKKKKQTTFSPSSARLSQQNKFITNE